MLIDRQVVGVRSVRAVDRLRRAVGIITIEVGHLRARLRIDKGRHVERLIVSQVGPPSGIFALMNLAAVSTRCMPAPSLKLSAPQS
jgi:hypothetical protein